MWLAIVYIVFFLLLTVLVYIALAPLILKINTETDLYSFNIGFIFRVWWEKDSALGDLKMQIFGIRRKLNFQKFRKSKSKKKPHSNSKPFKPTVKRIIAVLKSFKVTDWFITLDTGNMSLNGILFPVMQTFSYTTGKKFHINFTGKNVAILTVRNNALRILMAYFTH